VSGSPPAIEAERLGRDYGTTRALDALDLRVFPGSIVGLLGPNGAGKTTAMLLLATLLGPTRGTARIFGHDIVRGRKAIRQRLGLVFQETTTDGLLTVTENLLFAARLMGLRGGAAKRAVTTAIEWSGLAARARTPARQLSGGWRRVLDIVRALLHEPDLLILDEPTVGLDPEHRDRVWSLLDSRRRDQGVTVLFSTHYLTEAETADQVVLLAHGRVVASDSPSRLQADVGAEVAEIEGPGTERLVLALAGLGAAVTRVRTERGFRVGLSGTRDAVVELAGNAPGIERFTIRRPSLEDVYFARTQVSDPPQLGLSLPASEPSPTRTA
jgi:ABC-2 type transport system ATP-binding protein